MNKEKEFRLSEPILSRLEPLSVVHIGVREITPTDVIMSKHALNIDWNSDKNSRGGGYITLGFGRQIFRRFAREVDPYLIVSGLEVMTHRFDDEEAMRVVRNPYECLAAILTAVATINQFARKTGQSITHMVRANNNSLPIFERFRNNGLYEYCDLSSTPINDPKTLGELTFLSAQYPLTFLDPLKEFIVPEAVDLLISMQRKILTPAVGIST